VQLNDTVLIASGKGIGWKINRHNNNNNNNISTTTTTTTK
jgi:hypothetical protein